MESLITNITSATENLYTAHLLAMFGVYCLITILWLRPSWWVFRERPRFPRLWNSAAWLFIGAATLSIYEFYAAGAVTWPDKIIRTGDAYARNAYGFVSAEIQSLQDQPATTAPQKAALPRSAVKARVTHVTDGDTIKVSAEGEKLTIRLQGIDAPEKNQQYGSTSTRRLKSMLPRTIYLDKESTDRYGRTIATLYSEDGVNINARMVCEGHAWWYKRYARFDTELSNCQETAMQNKLGLWRSDEPIPPWEFRRGAR